MRGVSGVSGVRGGKRNNGKELGRKGWTEGCGEGEKKEAKEEWKGRSEGLEVEVITGEGAEGTMRGKWSEWGRWRFGSH